MSPIALRRPALPERSEGARARLEMLGQHARPVTAARDRTLVVPGPLGALLPGGVLRRGSAVTVDGRAGAGVTSIALELAAGATAAGEWAAAVDLDGTLGAEAAAEAGVALERLAVLRGVPPARWAVVVAILLDGVSLVVADVPRHVSAADARRLVARARERDAVLVALPRAGTQWPAEAVLRLFAEGGRWRGLDAGGGLLSGRDRSVRVEGRGAAARARTGVLAPAV